MLTGDADIEVDRPNMKYDNYEKLAGRVREFRLEYRDLSDHKLVNFRKARLPTLHPLSAYQHPTPGAPPA